MQSKKRLGEEREARTRIYIHTLSSSFFLSLFLSLFLSFFYFLSFSLSVLTSIYISIVLLCIKYLNIRMRSAFRQDSTLALSPLESYL